MSGKKTRYVVALGLMIVLTSPLIVTGFLWQSFVFAFTVGRGLFETVVEKS